MKVDSSPPDFFAADVQAGRRFYHGVKNRRGAGLSVVAGGWEVCAPAYRVERKSFPHFSIEWVAEGRGRLQLGGRRHELRPGVVFTYGPGVAQSIACEPGYTLRKYFVDFDGPIAPARLRAAGLVPGFCGETRRVAGLRAVWEELVRLGARPNSAGRDGAVHALELLISMLGDDRIGMEAKGRAEATLERCEACLQTHFLQLRTLAQLAAACGVQPAYLCRLYQRFRGQTPYESLQYLRMSWAAGRLREGPRLVREVADELGLDPFQFSRAFKRLHGLSPQAFQRRYGL